MTPKTLRPARRSAGLLPYLLIAPALGLLAATLVIPIVSAVDISLHDIRVIGAAGPFSGADNYLRVLADPTFWAALGTSAVWVVGNALVQTLLAVIAALVLDQRFPGVRIARVWIILTWIVPTVVIVIIWRWLLSPSGGLVNPLLIQLGLIDRPVGFFASGPMAMTSLILINSWRWFPFVAVMLLAALQRIPADVYEAAAVDGANPLQRFFAITWPLLKPTLLVLTVMGTLLSFNVFDVIWLLTAGGPAGATRTLPVLIYETAFKAYRMGDAAAMSVIASLLMIGLAVMLLETLAPKEKRS
ncbi:carbohydrate ABC transporter permease [Prosthecomicrobium pneumaticum]|uniref:Multiple sugar transport system permease protein n=1 Tax=Prosthecomicrobium pneumaticum TaxID=81895 RepID=A0A7W9L219_9HYPH|nr:sugar ABC transporter permease [Prosthecomicrobium pneumaticum]MBB5753142.1 multiple sugar transport system permease protein [Prosthecomicrobium pneumaticum]